MVVNITITFPLIFWENGLVLCMSKSEHCREALHPLFVHTVFAY